MRPNNYLIPWAFVCFDVFLAIVASQIGLFQMIMLDTSFISLGIFIVYLLANILPFALVYFDRHNSKIREYIARVSWWIVSAFPMFGMLGTVLGFSWLFLDFFQGDFSNVAGEELFREKIGPMGSNIFIALISTASGIVATVALSLKLVIMNNAEE